MSLNLKQENRKKFQDKTKLKRHHKKNYAKVVPRDDTTKNTTATAESTDNQLADEATSGSRSRSGSVTGGNSEEQPQEPEAPSNVWRYEEEITIHGHDDTDEDLLKKIDFKKLYLKKDIDLPQKKKSDEELLNELLMDSKSQQEVKYEYEEPSSLKDKKERSFRETPMKELKKTMAFYNSAPAHLKSDEDFLDSLI